MSILDALQQIVANNHESYAAMKSPPIAKVLPPGTRLREYLLKEVIGSGGFGITYLAEDDNLSRQVVIKEFFPEAMALRKATGVVVQDKSMADLFAWSLKRFMDEARVIASFDHPNIVKILQYFSENNTAYFVMPFLVGTDLKTFLNKQKQAIPEAELYHWMEQLLDGLQLIHQRGVLHRDIKPANLLICDNGTRPVLIDFGSSRQAYHQRSRSLAIMITKGFSPIEQYSLTSEQGEFSDIYSLGATFYTIVRGKAPPDAMARVEATFANNLPDPCESLANHENLPFKRNFLQAIDWALSIHAKDRPQTIAQWRTKLPLTLEQLAPVPISNHDKIHDRVHNNQKDQDDATTFYSPDIDAWATVVSADCYEGYLAFIQNYPNSIYIFEARAALERHAELKRRLQTDSDAWDKAKELNSIAGYRDYLATVPWGHHRPTALAAISSLDEALWAEAVMENTIDAYQRYLTDCPDGVHTTAAHTARSQLEEAERERQQAEAAAWMVAVEADTLEGYQQYYATYPTGTHAPAAASAITRLQELEQLRQAEHSAWENTVLARECQLDAYLAYAAAFPKGIHTQEVDAVLEEAYTNAMNREAEAATAWEVAQSTNTLDSYRAFLKEWPESGRLALCLERIVTLRRQTAVDAETHTSLGAIPTNQSLTNETASIDWYRKAAAQGSAQAQTNLGVMLSNGRGVPKDEVAAVKWYRKAAEQGYAAAQFNLGVMLADGRGVDKDDVAAVEWFRKAANQGNAYAQFNLGRMLERGRGIAQDEGIAVTWYRKAAVQGNAYAQFNLARMLEKGRGIAKDEAAAVEWYRKAALQGNAHAQNNLAVMLETGRGVASDKMAARDWFQQAAAQGHANARDNLNRLLLLLTTIG